MRLQNRAEWSGMDEITIRTARPGDARRDRPARCRDLAGGLCRHPDDAVSRRAVDAAARDRLGDRHPQREPRDVRVAVDSDGDDPRLRQLRPQPRRARISPARSSPSTSRPTGRTRGSAAGCCSRCSSGWSTQGHGSAIIWVLRDNPARFFYQRLGGSEVRRKMLPFGGKQVDGRRLWLARPAALSRGRPARGRRIGSRSR